jgi:hypothetical protein
MTTFKQFILENTEPDLAQIIKTHCGQFLRESACEKMYRGVKSVDFESSTKSFGKVKDTDVVYFTGTPRTDRKPKDTNQLVHDLANDWFEVQFGWPARSEGLFCSGSWSTASMYGRPCLVFPMDGYKYIWSNEVSDFYTDFDDIYEAVIEEYDHRSDFEEALITSLNDFLGNAKFRDTRLADGIKSCSEIMIKCKSYILSRQI